PPALGDRARSADERRRRRVWTVTEARCEGGAAAARLRRTRPSATPEPNYCGHAHVRAQAQPELEQAAGGLACRASWALDEAEGRSALRRPAGSGRADAGACEAATAACARRAGRLARPARPA